MFAKWGDEEWKCLYAWRSIMVRSEENNVCMHDANQDSRLKDDEW